MAETDTKQKDLDQELLEQETPDHAAPLRADIMGSMIKANPATPGYLGTLDHLMTAHGAVEDTSSMGGAPMMGGKPAAQPDAGGGQPSPTMGAPKPQGWLGKIGHVASRMGNIAGDVLSPGTMINIPGSDMNKRFEASRAEKVKERQQQLGIEQEKADTEKLGVSQRPEMAEAAGAEKERLRILQDQDTAARLKDTLANRDRNTDATIGSREKMTAEQIASRDKQSQLANSTRQMIAKEHEAAETGRTSMKEAGANSRAAIAQDPNKLTNAMKTMKQQAQATLPQIEKAISETLAVKDLLGPEAGRWNDFIQGKIGVADPKFAHYRDEIHMVSTAVTLAHARGRMSNELYESFQQMFDAGKQSPENMIQALDVAQEWLTDYANMGEGGKPEAAAGGKQAPAAGTVEGGYRFKGGDPANKSNWEKAN